MSVRINLLPRKIVRERVWKTLNVVVGITTILNVSMVGSLMAPRAAQAQTVGQPEQTVTAAQPDAQVNSAPTPATNPGLGQSCGLDISLVIDRSGSVSSTEMGQMKTALKSFVDAFTGTPTQFSVTKFDTTASVVQNFTSNLTTTKNTIDAVSTGGNTTNWEDGLIKGFSTFDPRTDKSNLLVIATDGSPNTYNNGGGTSFDWTQGLYHAITEANIIKTAAGTAKSRIVALGIGSDPTDPSYPNTDFKLQDIAGPTIATTPAAITTSTDVIKVTDFTGIGAAVAAYAKALCGGKILVQKQFDTDGNGIADVTSSNALLSGWTFDVNGTASNPSAQVTDNSGFLQFNNVLNGSNYSVVETQKAGTKLVNASCVNGTQPVGSVNLATGTISGLTMGTDDNISCTFVNGYSNGTITVNKKFDDNGDGQIDRTNPQGWTWDIANGTQDNVGDATKSLVAGNYTVTEDAIANYTSTWTCSNQASGNGTSIGITLAANQALTCTFTNTRDTGTIELKKAWSGTPGQTTLNIGTTSGAGNTDTQLTGLAGAAPLTTGVNTVVTGTYFVSENGGLANYTSSLACTDNGTPVTPGVNNALTVAKGHAVVCTFTNTRNTGRLMVNKDVDTDGDGKVDVTGATNWTWDIVNGEQNIATGQGRTLDTGVFTIAEDQKTNFHVVDLTCNGQSYGAVESAQVTVGAQGLTCTFTNARDTGGLTVIKSLDTNGDGIVDQTNVDGWTWDRDSGNQNYPMGSTQTVLTGVHTVTEDQQSNYYNLNWVCVDSQTQTQIGSGAGELLSVYVSTHGATCTFSNSRKTGTIEGYKFNDLNNNGSREAGEPGLQGWTIQLSTGASALTDGTGHYQFNLVPTGTNYTVNEVQQAGWTNTTPLSVSNVVVSYNQSTTVNFGNFKLGKISGYKYEDSTEGKTLRDWEICISSPALQGDACTSTNDGGFYQFTDLPAGTYSLYEFGQYGWQAVAPADGQYDSIVIMSGSDVQRNFVNTRNAFNVDIEKTGPETVEAGTQLTYTLTWSVSGNTPIEDVVVTDPIGTNANMTFVSATCGTTTGTCVMSNVGGNETWSLGTRNPGESGTVTVTVAVAIPVDNGTVLSNTGKVCGAGQLVGDFAEKPVTTEKCDTDTTTTVVHSAPTISFDKSGPATVTAGGNIVYTLAWSIGGNGPATEAVVTDAVPANSTFVSATCGTTGGACTMSAVGSAISWSLGTRQPGDSGTVTMTVKSLSPIANGTVITNTACFDSEETEQACDTTTTIVESSPTLSITKSNDVIGFTNPGKQVNYTITVTNASTATDIAHNVVINDTLPAGFTFADTGLATKSTPAGDLAVGQTKSFTFLVNISSSQTAAIYTNTATAKGDNTLTVTATSPVDVRVPTVFGIEIEPTLVLTKTVDVSVTNPGKMITYTVTISNPGDLDVTNVRLSDKLPKGFVFADSGKDTRTWDIGTLKAHHQRVINYPVKLADTVKAGKYDNVATVLSNELDPISAKAKVEVKVPKVLGLATTGVSTRDYLLFSVGFGLMSVGLFWVARLRRRDNDAELA